MEQAIRILMNEDDVDQVELNELELKREGIAFITRRAETRQDFLAALEEFKPDVILTDYQQPKLPGMETLKLVQERHLDIPVIIVTGSIDEETAADTIKSGAADYVIKQRLVRLGIAVKSALEKQRIRKAKEEAEKALRESYAQVKEQSAELQKANASLEADIEKQHEYEKRLQDAAEYAESIIRAVRHPLVVLDEELRVASANEAFYQFFMVTGEETEGRFLVELGSRQWGADGLRDILLKVIPENKAFTDYEVEQDFPHIGHRVILVSGRRINQEGHRRQLILLAMEDITESKKSEDILRRNEYELRTLVDNSPDLIIRMNRRLQYVYVNSAYERLTGISREQFIGITNKELGMSPQMVESWESAARGVIESGREHLVEFEMTGFFGKRYFSTRLLPEFAKTGVVETLLLIARDITERKRAEEQIRYISFHDEVTGLFNRAFFEEEIRRVDTERDLPISIIIGDVNNLKLSNDVFGHEEGDKLLKGIADIFRKACRQSDIVARWGGDEFAVILPKTVFATANEICTRIGQIAKVSKGTAVQPSIALGIATKDKRDQNIYQVIRQAEQGMYDNKFARAGENKEMVLSSLLGYARERRVDYDAHIERCYQLARVFGRELDLSEDLMKDLHMLIELHDIGDAAIPQDILMKPGRLNGDEWNIVKKHSEVGYKVAKTYSDTAKISDEVLSHGEYWDGTGYPRGLKGAEIPCLSRVFLIMDAFDVMTHPRPYARTLTQEEAIAELRRNAGQQFDPELTEAFIKVLTGAAKDKAPV